MNRAEIAYGLLKEKGEVRMGDLPQGGEAEFIHWKERICRGEKTRFGRWV